MHISKCVCVKFNGIDLSTPEFKSIVIFILRLIGPNKFILMLSICYIAPACIINVSYHQNAELLNLTHMLRGIQTCQYVGIKVRASCLCVIVLYCGVVVIVIVCCCCCCCWSSSSGNWQRCYELFIHFITLMNQSRWRFEMAYSRRSAYTRTYTTYMRFFF